jgi:hypothetical protein
VVTQSKADLQPGRNHGTGHTNGFCFCRCEFSVSGPASNVRATMAVGPGDATRAVLDAR